VRLPPALERRLLILSTGTNITRNCVERKKLSLANRKALEIVIKQGSKWLEFMPLFEIAVKISSTN
jgi:hypothetical protein